jgi:hypothetical protein
MHVAAGRALLARPEPKDVPSRVGIPVELKAAGAADVRADLQGLAFEWKGSAAGADLRGVTRAADLGYRSATHVRRLRRRMQVMGRLIPADQRLR